MNRRFATGMLLIAVSVALLCKYGCEYLPESTFELSQQSRLPKWVKLPKGRARPDVSLSMSYYIDPTSGMRAIFTLRDKTGEMMWRERGTLCGLVDQTGSPVDARAYPAFQAITIDGVMDVVEHKAMEPVFYMADDAAVWRHYASSGCRS